MILRNHGLLTCGPTVREAFDLMYYLERACQAQVAAMAGGAELVAAAARGRAQGRAPVRAARAHGAGQRLGGAAADARPHGSVVRDVAAAMCSYTCAPTSRRHDAAPSRSEEDLHEQPHRDAAPSPSRCCAVARRRRRRSRIAQDKIDKPVKILVGFAAGGTADMIARVVADKMKATHRAAGDRREPAGRDRTHRRRRREGRGARTARRSW